MPEAQCTRKEQRLQRSVLGHSRARGTICSGRAVPKAQCAGAEGCGLWCHECVCGSGWVGAALREGLLLRGFLTPQIQQIQCNDISRMETGQFLSAQRF